MTLQPLQLVACEDFCRRRKAKVLIPATVSAINNEMVTLFYRDMHDQFVSAEVHQSKLQRFNMCERKLRKNDVIYAPWINTDKSVTYELYRAVVLRDEGQSDVVKVKFDGDKLQRYSTSRWVVIAE